ncbi:MAG: ATP-binding protein [Porticoccaceae bacterium]|nr:ATP-binding protein [Porticoccaceae bacterium]
MAANKRFSSIHSRLLITSLLPLTLLCMVLASYMISNQRVVLLANLKNIGSIAVQQVSSNAEFALYSNNQAMLRDIGESVLDIPSVKGLAFYNLNQDSNVTIGSFDLSVVKGQEEDNLIKPFYADNLWYFYAPITGEDLSLLDYDEGITPEPEMLGWVVVSVTDEILMEQRREGIFAVLVVSTLGLLIAAWIAMRIGRSISRPLENLTETVDTMEAGNLNLFAPEEGPMELRKLASGINQLSTSVRQYNVRMQSEVARATAQLQITLIELEDAMEAQDQFLARMSHELRTPLTAVIGFSKLLAAESDARKREESLRIISMSSNMLLTMIDDILEFSKARAGGFTLEKVSFNIDSWMADLLAIHGPRAEERGLILNYSIDENVPKLLIGDPVRFTQVISNLLSNAVKFTDRGGVTITISCIAAEDKNIVLHCSVEDTGKGIKEEKIPVLFDPFSQEDTSINRRFGGAGLGLSICKSLVQAMGGEIKVRSMLGHGSVFSFTCQLALADKDKTLPQIANPLELRDVKKTLAGVTVLVAEDNPFNQKLIVRLLSAYGAKCLTADNGLEAIKIAEELHLDVILMDIHMPVIDGITACETIVQQSGDSPPIIALTADVTLTEENSMKKAGAEMMLLKPVDEDKLIRSLTKVLPQSGGQPESSGMGLLSTVVPVDELKNALYESLDKLDDQLNNSENASLRGIIHDLMGLSGLYGMSELRELVMQFRADYGSLNAEDNLSRVEEIRQHIKGFVFD